MDEISNPFTPGAGNPPPELAGRTQVLQDANIALGRIINGRHHQSQILLGLRGVGKTVLLNRVRREAKNLGFQVAYIEAPEGQNLEVLLVPEIRGVLHRLSIVEAAKEKAHIALRALKSFALRFQISYQDIGISVNPSPGVADSGDLGHDLQELLITVGETAAAANRGAAIFIDEVQYLKKEELSALIVSLHRVSQEQLPVIFFGCGLPQIAKLTGDAKSYAERLFEFPEIGPLSFDDVIEAIREPILREGATIDDDALVEIVRETEGYPYFVQEWGYQAWNIAEPSRITKNDALEAKRRALSRLDGGFFRVRFNRLTPHEEEYVRAMAEMGPGPQRSSEIAGMLKRDIQAVAQFRSNLIKKGMVYSPSYGDTAFTVPMFDAYLRRVIPNFGLGTGLRPRQGE